MFAWTALAPHDQADQTPMRVRQSHIRTCRLSSGHPDLSALCTHVAKLQSSEQSGVSSETIRIIILSVHEPFVHTFYMTYTGHVFFGRGHHRQPQATLRGDLVSAPDSSVDLRKLSWLFSYKCPINRMRLKARCCFLCRRESNVFVFATCYRHQRAQENHLEEEVDHHTTHALC